MTVQTRGAFACNFCAKSTIRLRATDCDGRHEPEWRPPGPSSPRGSGAGGDACRRCMLSGERQSPYRTSCKSARAALATENRLKPHAGVEDITYAVAQS